MPAVDHKAVFRQFIEEVCNHQAFDQLDAFVSSDFVDRTAPPDLAYDHVEALKLGITLAHEAFPDAHWTIECMVVEGNNLAARVTLRGTHRGAVHGVRDTIDHAATRPPAAPASGQRVEVRESHFVRFAEGKIVEHWHITDNLQWMLHLGLVTLVS